MPTRVRLPFEEGLEPLPWQGDARTISSLRQSRAGLWVIEAAELDYANLTEIMGPLRLASNGLPAHLRLAQLATADYLEGKHASLIRAVQREGRATADGVPLSDQAATLKLATRFHQRSPGHVAVEAMSGQLQELITG